MNADWLWDRKISLSEAKKALSDPEHKRFILLAALLLARKNNPKEVFRQYLDPLLFCKHWLAIKNSMRKDKWASERIIFWQAVYEKLKEKYRKRGIKFKEKKGIVINELCQRVGIQIRNLREKEGLTQFTLAKRLSISQQVISRVERGEENISLITLAKITKALNKKIEVVFT